MLLFSGRGHNPDVLTCIANLSNDEVFTPPSMANAMLDLVAEAWARDHDGASIWEDPEVTFLDPFTKSGVFLREITRRLTNGLVLKIPDLQQRVNHILTQQVFGIAITELTALLARRSVYCSKFANGKHSICTEFDAEAGNIWFERTEHTWTGGTRENRVHPTSGEEMVVYTHRRCSYCGASEDEYARGTNLETHAYAFIHTDNIHDRITEIFGDSMHFDVVIGNPPYQLSDGGYGTSARPIYQEFVEQAKKLEPRYLSMVIPSRWFAGGKGLDEFRNQMLHDNRLRSIHDFWLAGDAFPGVAIQGGILYFLWSRDHKGTCEISTHYAGKTISKMSRSLVEDGDDIFIRYNEAIPILAKIRAIEESSSDSNGSFESLVSSRKPFGVPTNFEVLPTPAKTRLQIYWNGGSGYKTQGLSWIEDSSITVGRDLIDVWKVFISAAYGDRGGGGASRDAPPKAVIGRPFKGKPGEVCTETYLCIGPLATEQEADNVCAYLSCKLIRFLIMLRKPSQHATKKVYGYVPRLDFTKVWTDELLYQRYGLTQDEIDFVEWMIRPMILGDE
ncbi:MAG: Eco57I restriction-modification methylase domain-containing protein [Actinomycetaceae bacterium]|nr:Eco57I restriction-modification methylase domain-containing protein [Actinomycetaceae bacterium]